MAVVAASVLAGGVRATFINAYKTRYSGMAARLAKLMDLALPTDKLTETYPYFDTAPYPERVSKGEPIRDEDFGSNSFTCTNYEWARGVSWFRQDREDDQIQGIMTRAKQTGEHWATLAERIYFEFLSQSASLLPSIPNSPDGAALFATSRFGLAAGNIRTGLGVATPEAVVQDFVAALAQAGQFQDTKSQPLNDDIIDGPITIIYPIAHKLIFERAFLLGTVEGVVSAQENIINKYRGKIDLYGTQRLSGNDWFLNLDLADPKPVFEQARRALEEIFYDERNDAEARRLRKEGLSYTSRSGYGSNLPFGLIKVDN